MKTVDTKRKITHNRFMLTIAVSVMILCSLFIHSQMVNAKEQTTYTKSFTTIEIQAGDTLSSIADTYMKPGQDLNSYVEEVMYMNNLKSDKIHTGCYLVVPIYTIENDMVSQS